EIRRSVFAVVNDEIGAAIEELLVAVADEAQARAQADLALTAQFNGFSASGMVKFEVAATSEGALASYTILVNAGSPESPNFKSAGRIIDVMDNGEDPPSSRIVLLADQTVIYDGVAGVLFQNGKLTGVGGKAEFDLLQGRFIIYRETT